MKLLFAAALAGLLGCGQAATQPEDKAPLETTTETTTQNGITNMAIEEKDLKCTQPERDFLTGKLAAIPGFDAESVPWKQIGPDFFFIPESVSGSNGQPEVVIRLAKLVLATMPP